MKKVLLITLFFLHIILSAGSLADSLFFASKKMKPKEKCEFLFNFLDNNYRNYPKEAEKIAKKSLEIAQKNKLYKEEAQAYTYLGMLSKNIAEFEKANEYYKKAQEIAKKIGDEEYIANILINKAVLLTEMGKHQDAIDTYKKALKIYEKFNNEKKIIDIYYNLSVIYRQIGKFDIALDYAIKSLKYDEEHNKNKNDLAASCDNLAIIYYYLKKPEKAIAYFERALSLRKKANNKRGIAYSYNNLAVIYKSQKKYDKAKEYLFKSLEIKKELGNKVGIASTLNNIGNFYRDLNNYKEAEKYYLESLKIKEKIGNPKNLILTLIDLGNFYAKQKKFKLFEKNLKKAEKIAKENKLRLQLSNIYKSFSENYYLAGDYKKAYLFSEKYISLRDSLIEEENLKKIAELQVKYETEKKEKQIQILKKTQEKQILLRNFFLLLFFIAIVFIIILYKLFKAKKQEIIYKNKIEQHILETNRTLEKRVQEELEKRQKQQALLIQKSKLESLGRLSAGIAHEINQPVTHLSLGLDNILIRKSMKKLDGDYLDKKINELFGDIERIRNIIEHIRTFSRAQGSTDIEKVDVNQVIKSALQLIQTQYRNHGINIELSLSEKPIYILGNKYKLEQVLLNMFSNAKDSIEEKYKNNPLAHKEIKVRVVEDKDNVNIEVEDNGLGISEEIMEKMFDPFYTTKPIDKGTGLGLSISYGIIKEMEGDIKVRSEIGKYVVMTIILPKI